MQGGRVHRLSVPSRQWVTLPKPTAHLADPTKGQYDTLIVYALRDRADLDSLHLNLGNMSTAEETAQAKRVMERLDKLPGSRVERRETGYRIVPARGE